MVKFSAAACVLLVAGSANAYSIPSRSTLRSLGSKSIPLQSRRSDNANLKSNLKMEDFGFLKGSGIGFGDLWNGEQVISEVALE